MKFIVSSSALLKQLQHIAGVINTNTVLPIFEDFLFEVGKNKLTVVATDAHRLARYNRKDVSFPNNDSFIVPSKPLNLLHRWCYSRLSV